MMSNKVVNRGDTRSKIFVSSEGAATISCPKCGVTKQIAVAHYCGKKHTIKIRCRCGEPFLIYLEFRQSYRKKSDLAGTYRVLTNGGGGGTASILNLSRAGLGFSVSGIHDLQVGQKALVDFVLDNRKSTRLSKEVVIRSVSKNHIGCEFSGQQAFEKDLGFYLQP